MRTLTSFVVLGIILLGCSGLGRNPASPNPAVVPDSELCGAMCDHLEQLGCEEGRPVYDSDLKGPQGVPNESCEAFCKDQQSKGTFVNPRCVMVVKTCADIEPARQHMCTP